MPEFDRESGSKRINDFIFFLRDAGWKVTFGSRRSTGRHDRYVRLLEDAGVVALPALGDDISELMQRERFDLAILAFWHIGELCMPQLRAWSPGTTVIVDSVDLHFLRNARHAFMQPTGGAGASFLDASIGSEIVRELNTYAAADAVLTVSEKEANLLNVLLGDQATVTVVPDGEDVRRSSRPFSARHGLLFVGNFRHAPNVDAINYLCLDILPRLPARVLEAHPVYVVGNDVNEEVRAAVAALPSVRLVGWVPDLRPYLEQARVAIVPLRYGAGTKRKLVQSLMIGTPSVSSTIGAEGLDLQNGKQVVIADTPDHFAKAVIRLLGDERLWQRLASNGRQHIMARHGRAVARRKFLAAVERAVGRKRPKLCDLSTGDHLHQPTSYSALVKRIRIAVELALPRDACVLVVSKGDEALLDLEGRRGWHFPQANDGSYTGHHPHDAASVIAQLETLREQGAQYLLLPSTGLWWLEYYQQFRQHLEQRYRLAWGRHDTCLIFALTESGAETHRARFRCGPLATAV